MEIGSAFKLSFVQSINLRSRKEARKINKLFYTTGLTIPIFLDIQLSWIYEQCV